MRVLYTCATCNRDVDAEDCGLSEAGIECDDCLDERVREAFRDLRRSLHVDLHAAAGEAMRNWVDDVRTHAKDHH